jgi:hypothetical protein
MQGQFTAGGKAFPSRKGEMQKAGGEMLPDTTKLDPRWLEPEWIPDGSGMTCLRIGNAITGQVTSA